MIDFIGVSKRYGHQLALNEISLSLHEPKIYCLLGRNGAGKTTFMRLIAGKIAASAGEVSVGGARVSTLNMPENVRYIESAQPQFNMRIVEMFKFASEVDPGFDVNFALRMADKFKLNKKKKYNSLSFGMKTMVTSILSLASNADVILLDEPVLGFDPVMRREFYELLSLSFAEHPRIIVISTHLIDEIANTAQHILMLSAGTLVVNEQIDDLLSNAYKVSGLSDTVELVTRGKHVLGVDKIGKFSVAYVLDKRINATSDVEISPITLQELFVRFEGESSHE